MYFSTSDGKEIYTPGQCSCCRMNTAGEHEWNCPLFAEKPLYEKPHEQTYEELCKELKEPNGNHLLIGRFHKVF